MKNVLETTLLEFEKSDFHVELVEHSHGQLYLEIIQTIHDDPTKQNTLKINPTILSSIISVLQNYYAKTFIKYEGEKMHLTDLDQQKIQDRYLKGVHIEDLALQFNQSKELIEMVLRNKGIAIVPNKIIYKRRK